MKLIVGLGNPGKEYEKTRHNVGFIFIDELAVKHGLSELKKDKKFNAEVSKASLNGAEVLLVKPLTFMNLSGQALQSIMHFYRVEAHNVLVIYDDIDLPLGTIRLRSEGSAGTHNGMKSVIEVLGTQNIPRLRIGIESRGTTAAKEQELSSFVLSRFLPEEMAQLPGIFKEAEKEVLNWLE